MRIWNYNKSPEETYRGVRKTSTQNENIVFEIQVKRLYVQLNDKIISPKQGFLLRRAPGHCYFDFVQEIVFAQSKIIHRENEKK